MKKFTLTFSLIWVLLHASAQISITSRDTLPLNKKLFDAGFVDMSFGNGNVERDLLSDKHFLSITSTGWTGYRFSGESTADYNRLIIGSNTIYDGIGKGYNCVFCGDIGGVCCVAWSKDFFNEFDAFCSQADANMTYIANVQTGSLEEIYWAIDCGATTIVYGGEQNLKENAAFWPQGGTSYKLKINQWIDSVDCNYPNITHIVDMAPTWITNTTNNLTWNKNLSGLKGDAARMYFNASDMFDQQTLESLNDFWNTKIGTWISNFQSYLPNHGIAVNQLMWKQTDRNINSFLNQAFLYDSWYYALNNQNLFKECSYQSLKSLEDIHKNNKATATLFGKLFNNQNLVSTTTSYENTKVLTGVTNGEYDIIFYNESSRSHSVSVKLDGSKKSVEYETHSYPTITSTSRTVTTGEGKTITIPAYSITWMKFTAVNTTVN